MPKIERFLYFENSSGQIWKGPGGYLRLEYRAGPREEVQLRALLAHTGQAMRRRLYTKILIDRRDMAPLSPSE